MYIDKISFKGQHSLIEPSDNIFDILLNVLKLQLTILEQLVIYDPIVKAVKEGNLKLYNTNKPESIPIILEESDKLKVNVYLPLQKWIKSGYASTAIYRKIAILLIAGFTLYKTAKLNLIKNAELKKYILKYMYSFYFQAVGRYHNMLLTDDRTVSIFETIVLRYVSGVLYDSDLTMDNLKNLMVNYDSSAINTVYDMVKEPINTTEKFIKALVNLKLLDKSIDEPAKLISYTKYSTFTLWSLERFDYLCALLYSIKFFTDGFFDDKLSKYNYTVFKEIVDLIGKEIKRS